MRKGPAHRMLGTFDCRRSDSKLSRYRQCTVRVTGLRSVLSPFWDRPQRVQQPPRAGLAIAMSCKQVGLPLPGEALSVVTRSRCLSRGVRPDRMRSCSAELSGSFVETRSRLRLSRYGRILPSIELGSQSPLEKGQPFALNCKSSRGVTLPYGSGSGCAILLRLRPLNGVFPLARHRIQCQQTPTHSAPTADTAFSRHLIG